MWFSKDTFNQMFAAGMIVDGRGGGLIVGRSHGEGHIFMIQESSDGRFFIPGAIQGGEYILNADAYFSAKERLEGINSFKDEHEDISPIPITSKSRILNTHSEPCDKMLLVDTRGQFIINKRATAKHFQEIEQINHELNGFVCCDLDILTPKVESQPGAV
jgi:hypothetical protein